MNYVWLDPLGGGYIGSYNGAALLSRYGDSLVFGLDLRNLQRGGELWEEIKKSRW